jgi:hypothetical protein
MNSPSEQLAHRYQLALTDGWKSWFDQDASRLKLPGMMRHAVSPDVLCQSAPAMIWPGFMLPDSLPLLGNQYGDWICGRVDADNQIRELIYWYHGGGDWIPVGHSMAEAVVHDAVDQFRNVRTQMLRGATESRIDSQAGVLLRLTHEPMLEWLVQRLPEREAMPSSVALQSIIDLLSEFKYESALELLDVQGWSVDAVACDRIEACLQLPIVRFASKEVAEKVGLVWFPEYIWMLFDIDRIPASQREKIMRAIDLDRTAWPSQDWRLAGEIADRVRSRRLDLGWATTIAGWYHERQMDIGRAVEVYSSGIQASSFTDQAVRFNSHAESENYGKFAAARLQELRSHWPGSLAHSSYVQILLEERKRSLLQDISHYWRQRAVNFEALGDYENAYACYFAWGWDLGVSRLTDYVEILAALVRCAEHAGWAARAEIAKTHLNCLQR